MSPEIPQFTHLKHSAQGRDERLDWLISKLKNYSCYNNRVPENSNLIKCQEKLDFCCKLLRLSKMARRDYINIVLLELGIIKT